MKERISFFRGRFFQQIKFAFVGIAARETERERERERQSRNHFNPEANKLNLPKTICSPKRARSANFYDRAQSKQDDVEDLGAANDRVKIKRHCNVDSSHVACNSFRVTTRIAEYRRVARCQRVIVLRD